VVGFVGFQIACTWIPAGHVGVMYSARSGLVTKNGKVEVLKPKRVFVPPYHQLLTYPTLTKVAVYNQDAGEGEQKSADGVLVTTSDNAQTIYDVAVYYHVDPENVPLIFKSFGAIPIDDIQQLHIRRAVREACNVVGPQADAFSMMGSNREKASKLLCEQLKDRLARKGVTVERAFFCQAYPTQNLVAKIEGRVNSLTDLTISGIRKDIADYDRRTAVVRATAEAEAAKISSAQTSQRSMELLQLEADIEAAKKWKGRLTPIQSKSGQILNVPSSMLSAAAAATTTEEGQ
jgi:regulator of protease activity HflC (stomatin/prohibitin superfamily)